MALRVSSRVRIAGLTTLTVLALTAGALVPDAASAAPHHTPPVKPTIQSVQQRLGQLAERSDQLVEKYNQATNTYKATRAAEAKAAAASRAAQRELAAAQDQLSTTAAAEYEGGTFSSTGALLSSDSGSSYLDHLDTLSMLSAHNAQTVNTFAATQKAAEVAKNKADELLAQAAANRAAVAKQRSETAREIGKYKKLLASLNAQQRALWLAQQNAHGQAVQTQAAVHTMAPALKSVPVTSSAVKKAIAFAIAQVGKPYVWGAAGPSSYDCSGLTMAAYAQAGISLPHSAAQQYGYGHHVSFDQMQPGDLMFFYQPVGHVTMYIGNGMMVSAPETGENVKIIPADTFGSDFVGATRLVG